MFRWIYRSTLYRFDTLHVTNCTRLDMISYLHFHFIFCIFFLKTPTSTRQWETLGGFVSLSNQLHCNYGGFGLRMDIDIRPQTCFLNFATIFTHWRIDRWQALLADRGPQVSTLLLADHTVHILLSLNLVIGRSHIDFSL